MITWRCFQSNEKLKRRSEYTEENNSWWMHECLEDWRFVRANSCNTDVTHNARSRFVLFLQQLALTLTIRVSFLVFKYMVDVRLPLLNKPRKSVPTVKWLRNEKKIFFNRLSYCRSTKPPLPQNLYSRPIQKLGTKSTISH